MATMQGYISGQDSQLDELPAWKRDLILRKRANVRMHGGFGLPTPTPTMAGRGRGSLSGRHQPLTSSLSGPPSSVSGPVGSVRGPHNPVKCSVSGPPHSHSHPSNNNAVSPSLDGGSVTTVSGGAADGNYIQKCAAKSEIVSANVSNMHHKGLNDEGPRVTSPTYSSFSDTCANVKQEKDEDFSYGPGIVSKLKNRYMSLAMRESRSRPSLRRFSSLEDLLDDPRETWPERGSNVAKPRHGHPTQANSTSSHRREVMKRARSVDSLSSRLSSEDSRSSSSSSSRGMPKSKSATSRLQSSLSALQKDDVIIIEATRPQNEVETTAPQQQQVNGGAPPPLTRKMSSSKMGREPEMPPPDTVHHVKKMFEPIGGRAVRGTKARVAAHKAAQANNKANSTTALPTSKPAIKAKPTDIPPRKSSTSSPSFPVTIEEAKHSLKQVAPASRASPRGTLSVRASALNGDAEESVGGGGGSRARPGLTPVTASVTAPLVNGGSEPRPVESNTAIVVEEGVRRVSNTAVSNIRKESQSQEFDFTRSSSTQQSHSKVTTTPAKQPSSPTPSPLPASPVISHRVTPTTTTPAAADPTHHQLTAPSITSSSKIEKSKETDRVQQENLKNAEKSREVPLRSPTKNDPHTLRSPAKVDPFRSAPPALGREPLKVSQQKQAPNSSQNVVLSPMEPKANSPFLSDDLIRTPGKGNLVEAFNKQPAEVGNSPILKAAANRDWRNASRGGGGGGGAQDNNTLVFNFTSSKKETPDYIENDGIDLSKRIPEQLDSGYVYMPGWEGPRDSSTDGDDFEDPGCDYLDARPGVIPPPSGIVFMGEAVIINGRSNLQRQPKTKKLTISFDDSAQTYEYPSEASLIEDNLSFSATSPSDLTDSSSVTHEHGIPKISQPVVTGTSSVTIRVGPAPQSPSTPSSQNNDRNKPISPPMPVRILSPDAPNFHSRAFLSSVYNPRPFNHNQNTNSSLADSVDAEIERASQNLVKGPKTRMAKTGSIKFAKKNKKPRPPPSTKDAEDSSRPHDLIDNEQVIVNKQPKVVVGSYNKGHGNKSSSPSPVPKPRLRISNEVNSIENKLPVTEVKLDKNIPSKTDLTLDIKPLYGFSKEEQNKLSYQPMPDVVSMTQKGNCQSSIRNEPEIPVKNTFRISKDNTSVLVSPAVEEQNVINSQTLDVVPTPEVEMANNHIKPQNKDRFIDDASMKPDRRPSDLIPTLHNSSKPHTRKHGIMSKRPLSDSTENLLHAELKNKFNHAHSAENVPRLRKVKTREPKSVKELFPDYKYIHDNNYLDETTDQLISSDNRELSVQPSPGNHEGQNIRDQNKNTIMKTSQPTKSKASISKSASPLVKTKTAAATRQVNADQNSSKRQKPPVASLRKNKANNKNVDSSAANKLKSKDLHDDASFNKNRSHGLVSYHESLRVPWKGSEESNFSRGANARKSYTKVVT